MDITLSEEQARTLLNVLDKAEYEFATSSNVFVTDRPDINPETKWEIDFSEILALVSEQISVLEKLGCMRIPNCPVYTS